MKIVMLDPKSIIIGERFRKDYGDLDSLITSIRMTGGNLQPIQVYRNSDGTYKLITGERRLRACMHLGIDVKAEVIESDDIPLKAREAIENIEREQFTWQEEIEAKEALHNLYQERAKELGIQWSCRKSAREMKIPVSGLSTELNLAQAVKKMPELFEGCKTKDAAMKVLKNYMIEEALNELNTRKSRTDYGLKAKNIVFHGDCLELIKTLPEGSVNAIITDPPFGIEYTPKRNDDSVRTYEDDPDDIIPLLKNLIQLADKVLKPDACFCMFCDVSWYLELNSYWESIGFKVAPIPAIWYKTSGSSRVSNPHLHMASSYECFIYGVRGNATIIRQGLSNVLPFPRQIDRMHLTQKPVALMEEIISRFCLPGYTVLDPMCGSGSTLVAAIKQGCKPIGFEIDDHFYQVAFRNVSEVLKAKDAGMLHLIKEEV